MSPDGTLSPTDIAGILFPADFADLITVGVADVAVVMLLLMVTHTYLTPHFIMVFNE